jgi:holo-[acyl-carrier protein] synthase
VIVGIGFDLVEIARLRSLVDRKGERALRRLFTGQELEYAHARTDPIPHLAARVAAKEATFKALSTLDGARSIGWREMEVVSGADGRPTVTLHGTAAAIAARAGVARVWVSLSHTQSAAGAVVVVERG